MAGFNPFRKFRVYQKYALAALGIMAMISFVILPSYFMLDRQTRGGAEGLIASCRRAGYGNVNRMLLQNLHQNHQYRRAFYNLLASQLFQATGGGNPWEFQVKFRTLAQIQESYQQRATDEALITNWLLTRYAQEKGMTVPDDVIVKRLQMISGGQISNQMLSEICQQLGFSDNFLIYLLREEMLAGYVQSSFFISTFATTPLEQWNLYQRVHRSLTAEVATLSVESFQKEVKEPSETELKHFFEENKNRVYNPDLPDSGFEIPTRFAFQIIDATPSEQFLASITREEIEKYYEDNKETVFLRQPSRSQDSQGIPQLPGSLPGLDSLFPTMPGGGRSSGLLPGLDSLPNPGLNAPSTGLNFDLGSLLEPAPTEQPQEVEELEFPQEIQEPTGESAEEPSDPQSQLTNSPIYRSVAYRQDETAEDEQETADGRRQTAEVEQEMADGSASAHDDIPESIKIITADEEPVADVTEPFIPTNEEESAAVYDISDLDFVDAQLANKRQEETSHSPLPTPHSEEFDPNILYQSLEEVENSIRQILAYQKIEAAMKEIERKMKEFYTAFTLGRAKSTQPLDLATLAAEYHLNVVTVDQPLSIYEVQQHECWQNPAYRPYLVKMFGENSSPYEVLLGQQTSPMFPSGGLTESIGWVTKKESRRVPEFTDKGIKELVRHRWLAVHARELAENRAKELATLANQSKDQSLTESLANQDVPIVETSSFTWFTQSMAQPGYRRAPLVFGEVAERGIPRGTADYANVHIKAPGADFMETAYSLQPGESGVAMNQPQMLVFVVRLVESSPDEELLWRYFITTPLSDYHGAGKEESQARMMRKWIDEIERNVGFQWVNRPSTSQFQEE